MPKSFLVRRFKVDQVQESEDKSEGMQFDNPTPDDATLSHDDELPIKCNCFCNQSDTVSTCSSDSLVSPLYLKEKFENIYEKLNSKIYKALSRYQYESSNENSIYENESVFDDDDEEKECFPRKGTYPISLGVEDTAKPFNCNICGKSFRLSSTLCRHKIIHTSQRPHKCYICFKSFNRSSTLKTHLRTHNTTKEFVCKVCGKGFHQKGNLRNHTLIHTGEKPYQCRICSKSFNKLSNLKFHMHCHTDQKPYRCRFCKVSMARRGELKQHIATFHGDEIEQK